MKMDAKELVKDIKNKQANDDEVIEWCEQHVENIDFDNSDDVEIYDRAIRIMMQCRINRLTENEAKVMIKYLSKAYMNEKGLADRVKISILSEEQFDEKYNGSKANAMCKHFFKETKFELDYSPNVMKYIRSGNINGFLDGLRIVYHETAHVIQNCLISLPEISGKKVEYTVSMFQIAQEEIARKADPNFYEENYSKLLLENQANKVRFV